MTFNVGDRVRAVETHEGNRIVKGDQGTVAHVGTLVGVDLDHGDRVRAFPERFELVPPKSSPFKKGDKVTWEGEATPTYTVVGPSPDRGYDVRVANDLSGWECNAYNFELKLVPPAYTVGDTVKVTAEGTVAYVDRTRVDVHTGQGAFLVARPSEVEKIEPPVTVFTPGQVVRDKRDGTLRAVTKDGWLNLNKDGQAYTFHNVPVTSKTHELVLDPNL